MALPHKADPREHLYPLEQLEAAETSDPVWNAAQRELVKTGGIHNYLRRVWGKKVAGLLAEEICCLIRG